MIIKKTLNLELRVGVSISGASGHYMDVEISEDSDDICMVMDNVLTFLLHDIADLNEKLMKPNGVYIHLYTQEVNND